MLKSGKSERCHNHFLSQQKIKAKGVTEFLILKNLSTNLYDTFQKCVLYARIIRYYHTSKSKGVTRFATPCDTFATPFSSDKEHFTALKSLQRGIFVTPFDSKVCHSAPVQGLQGVRSREGVTKPIHFVLKGVTKGVAKKYATFQSGQEVAAWQ
jgi:hypothetical protein